jgi:hypothetical protein
MSKCSKNALTHGVYAQEVVLPWEDAQVFDKIHGEIRRDLKPSGYLQEEAVRDIAKEIWRKQRLAIVYALPFYQKQMTPELMEAAKGGIRGLAAYLADQSIHSVRWMSTEDLLDEIKAEEAAARLTMPPEDDCNKPDEPPPKETNGITAEIVEQYDLATLEKQLKIETMVDNRIKNLMGRFFGLKTYAEMYGQKSTEVLPLLEAPPMNPSNASPPESHKVMTGPNGSSQQPKGKKKVKKGACD